ncbi:MAG TPA: nucleotidyltransferase domain-containing protein [Chitinophagales bacterium]|jgi:hypothetical protein|nr:nucleotidyltransferase domain-containing protein [Chitinophagales bacterium]
MQAIITDNINSIKEICRNHHVKEMAVFGSVTKDYFTDKSDIDVLIEFNDDIKLEDYSTNYFSFENSLNTLLKKEIDLVSKKFIENPYFLKSINLNKQILYVA